MVPLAADADLSGAIIRGLRRRQADIDLVRAVDALPPGTPDPDVLEWAAQEGRVLLTQDRRTMVGHAWARVAAGLPMPGLIRRPRRVRVRQAIEDLLVAYVCGGPEDFRDRVIVLPL